MRNVLLLHIVKPIEMMKDIQRIKQIQFLIKLEEYIL